MSCRAEAASVEYEGWVERLRANGPATDVVKDVLGAERTKRFFYEIFFAPYRY